MAVPQFHCAQAEPIPLKMRFNSVGQRVTLFYTENTRQELHHSRIGVHARKWLTVGAAPMPQYKSLGTSDHHTSCLKSYSHAIDTATVRFGSLANTC